MWLLELRKQWVWCGLVVPVPGFVVQRRASGAWLFLPKDREGHFMLPVPGCPANLRQHDWWSVWSAISGASSGCLNIHASFPPGFLPHVSRLPPSQTSGRPVRPDPAPGKAQS